MNDNYRQYIRKASSILPKGMLRNEMLYRKAWGAEALAVTKRAKEIFDPAGNPGVIFNDDPR